MWVGSDRIVSGAAYMLYLYRRVILRYPDTCGFAQHPYLDLREKAIFAPLLALTLWMGLYPTSFVRPIQVSANHIIEQVTAAGNGTGPRQASLR